MRIGLSVTSGWLLDDPRDGPRRMIERARVAHDAGLEFLLCGDHHNMASQYVQNTPVTGRLLAEWPGRPAGPLFLLPLWHPLLAAEHIGTLAAIHDAPLIVQTGLGRGDAQFASLGQDRSERGARIDAVIPAIQQLLAGEVVTAPALDMHEARVGLRPPEPVEWWIGAGVPAGVRRAARLGDCWFASPGLTAATFAPLVDAYRGACDEFATLPHVVLRRDVLVARDGADAERRARAIIEAGYRGMGPGQLIWGDVDSVGRQLTDWTERGVDRIAVRCMAADQRHALETLELLGGLT